MLITAACGMASANFSVSSSSASLNFGTQTVGTSSAPTPVTLTNTGSHPVTLQNATLTSTAFSLIGWTGGVSLPSGGTLTLQVAFTPTAATAYSGSLNVTGNHGVNLSVALSGVGGTSTSGSGGSTGSIAVSVSPTTASLQVGHAQQFAATVSGTTTTGVTWSVNGVQGGNSTLGTISTSGLYTAPAAVPSPASVTVSATSVADTSKSAAASVTILAAPTTVSVAISPTSASLQVGLTQQFTDVVSGTTNTGVTWSVNSVQGGNSTVGTISSAGMYTAPAAVPSTGSVTVAATSMADTTKSSSATVTIVAAPSKVTVAISPTSATVQGSGSQQFSATVSGTTNTSVSWAVNGTVGGSASLGTISSTGLYTAPACAGASSVTVSARSNYDTTASASAAVTISAASGNGNYYVSNSGSDSNDGSACHPWATIQHAANVVQPGNTVNVEPGTYTQNSLTLSTSGTSNARIRFVSDTRWGAKIRVTSSYSVVTINGNYTDFEGFDVAGLTGSCLGIVNWGSYNNVIGNHVHDIPADVCGSNGGAGIDLATYTSSGNAVLDNMVHDIGDAVPTSEQIHGIYLTGNGAVAKNNIIFKANAFGITGYHDFNQLQIINNTVFNNGAGGIVISTGGASTTPTGLLVANNIAVWNRQMPGINDGYGIQLRGTYSSSVITNNVVFGNVQAGVTNGSGVTVSSTIAADPQFVNYTGDLLGDYHLRSGSPAIDAGTTNSAPLFDFDNGPRPVGSGFDIGAYEYGSTPGTWPW